MMACDASFIPFEYFSSFTNDYRFAIVLKRFLASTMDSYTKDTHRYAFELIKAARTMPVDMAEKLQPVSYTHLTLPTKA